MNLACEHLVQEEMLYCYTTSCYLKNKNGSHYDLSRDPAAGSCFTHGINLRNAYNVGSL